MPFTVILVTDCGLFNREKSLTVNMSADSMRTESVDNFSYVNYTDKVCFFKHL